MPPADADPEPSGSRRPDAARLPGQDPDDPLSPGRTAPLSHAPPASPAPRVTLHLDAPDLIPPAAGWIEPLLDRAIALLDLPAAPDPAAPNLTLVLADDAQMADLHQRFTGVAGTTDVLTFDHRDDPKNPAEPLEADIVLGRDVAARQAQTRPHDARTELLLYAVHGLLHLLGEDDHEERAYQQMHQREDALLNQLGIGTVFKTQASRLTTHDSPPQEAQP